MPIFPIFVAASFLVGRAIPAFYDWTGSDQSRPSPLINQTAIGLLVCGMLICIALPWLPFAHDPSTVDASAKFQFKLRTILIVTAVVAVLLAVFRQKPLLVLGNGLFAFALFQAVQFWISYRNIRWRIISLLACMYFPFAWIVNPRELSNLSLEFLWMVNGLPAFIPTLLVSSLVQQHPEGLAWLSSILAGSELIVGLWFIRKGIRWAIAYHMFALIISIFGSFVLNALFRM